MRNGSKFAGRARLWLHGLTVALAVLLSAPRAFGHDLTIDRVALRLEARRLAGDLILDPELTGTAGTGNAREAALLKLVREELRIEIDGRPRAISFSVRELYSGDGAVPGDLVALSVPLETRPERFRVFVGARLEALVLSVRVRDDRSSSVRSVLVPGGNFSPPYTFGEAELSNAWKEGGPEQFEPLAPPSDPIPAPASPSARPPAPVTKAEGFEAGSSVGSFVRYLKLGFEHILPGGLDHVLFVICLVLGCRTFRPLLAQLTSFTLAHTLTLGLGALGLVELPDRVVEPLIALSIAFVALENWFRPAAASHRPLVVFGFGLLHGLGFAGALAEVGLSGENLVASLLAFNVGVELGQLAVVAVLFVGLGLFAKRERTLALLVGPASVAIAAVAGYWAVERLLG